MNTLATKSFLIILFLLSCLTPSQSLAPCNEYVLYIHDILFHGNNAKNATSAQVTKDSRISSNKHFGRMIVFDDPVTGDSNPQSIPAARAQGFYFFTGKDKFSAWFSMTLVFNSSDNKGTLTIMGADLITEESRDISVVGGTGDFFMARGFCTVKTDATERDSYFRLKLDIKLYQCY